MVIQFVAKFSIFLYVLLLFLSWRGGLTICTDHCLKFKVLYLLMNCWSYLHSIEDMIEKIANWTHTIMLDTNCINVSIRDIFNQFKIYPHNTYILQKGHIVIINFKKHLWENEMFSLIPYQVKAHRGWGQNRTQLNIWRC